MTNFLDYHDMKKGPEYCLDMGRNDTNMVKMVSASNRRNSVFSQELSLVFVGGTQECRLKWREGREET